MIVDMHVHTLVSSPCSSIDPVECIELAIERGLDAICITEHDTREGANVVKEIASDYGELKVFGGIEVMSRESHLLVYGYNEDVTGVPPAREVIEMVEEAGGIVIPAHPWRKPFGWYSGMPDTAIEETAFPDLFKVIEMYNGQQTIKQNEKGRAYCEKTGAPGIGGSDAHWIEAVGSVVTEFEEEIEDEVHLVELLRKGNYEARLTSIYYDEHE